MALSIGELVGYVDLDEGPAEASADRIGGMFGNLGGPWGKALAASAAVAGAALAASLAGAINMEPSRDRVAAALRLTEGQAARAGKVSGELYADAWGESMEEVDGAVEAVMSSIDGMRNASEADLRATTEAALILSDAMGVDVTRAAQVAGNMVSNGLAGDGVEAMDLLAAAMAKVPVQVREDVLDATDEYGKFFNQIGMDGPQAMAMLAEGAQDGMYGIDKAGDAVKEFAMLVSTDMARTKPVIEGLGLDYDKLANDMLAGGDKAGKATGKIVDGLLDMEDPAEQARAAVELFGTPLEDLGTDGIPDFLASLGQGRDGLGDFKGATEDMGDTLTDNAHTNIKEFKRGIETAFINTLGGQVLPVVEDVGGELSDKFGPALETVGGLVADLTGWLGDHTTTAKVLGGVIAALTVVTVAHSAAMAVGAAGGMAAWLMQTKLISGVTKVFTAVQWALNAAVLANPFVLVAVLLAALVVGLIVAYKKSDRFRAIVDKAFSVVGKAGTWLWEKALKPAFAKMKDGLEAVGKAGTWLWNNALQPAFKFIIGGVAKVLDMWAAMLRQLGKVPGFGWADRAADAMGAAADSARGMADGIKKIPNRKDVAVNVAYNYSGLQGDPMRGRGGMGSYPGFATGGRVTGSTLAWIGEGKEPESVLPDSVLRGLLERAHESGKNSGNGRNAPLIGQVVQAPQESADTLAERLWFKTRTRG